MTPPNQTMLHKHPAQPIGAYSRDDDPIYSTATPVLVDDSFSPASEATLAPSPPERTPLSGHAKKTEEESKAPGTIEKYSGHCKKVDLARPPTDDKVHDPTATTSTSNDREYSSAPGTAVESTFVEDSPSGGVTGVEDVSLEQSGLLHWIMDFGDVPLDEQVYRDILAVEEEWALRDSQEDRTTEVLVRDPVKSNETRHDRHENPSQVANNVQEIPSTQYPAAQPISKPVPIPVVIRAESSGQRREAMEDVPSSRLSVADISPDILPGDAGEHAIRTPPFTFTVPMGTRSLVVDQGLPHAQSNLCTNFLGHKERPSVHDPPPFAFQNNSQNTITAQALRDVARIPTPSLTHEFPSTSGYTLPLRPISSAPRKAHRKLAAQPHPDLPQATLPTVIHYPDVSKASPPQGLGHGLPSEAPCAATPPQAYRYDSAVPGSSRRPVVESSRKTGSVRPAATYPPPAAYNGHPSSVPAGPRYHHDECTLQAPHTASYLSPVLRAPVGPSSSGVSSATAFNGIRLGDATSHSSAVLARDGHALQSGVLATSLATATVSSASSGRKNAPSADSQNSIQHGSHSTERSTPTSQTSTSQQAAETPSQPAAASLPTSEVLRICNKALAEDDFTLLNGRPGRKCSYPGCGGAYLWGQKIDHNISHHGNPETGDVKCPLSSCDEYIRWKCWRSHVKRHRDGATGTLHKRKRNQDDQRADKEEGKRRK